MGVEIGRHGWETVATGRRARWRAGTMTLLGGLFLLRVVGQVLVTYAEVEWLPAVEHWQSGLLPYPALLASQLVILVLMVAIIADVRRGGGSLAGLHPQFGRAVWWFGCLYLASMVARYALTMALRPEWQWFERSISIFFHCILAVYLLVYSNVPKTWSHAASIGAERVLDARLPG